jgi:hypothetical protein
VSAAIKAKPSTELLEKGGKGWGARIGFEETRPSERVVSSSSETGRTWILDIHKSIATEGGKRFKNSGMG